MYMLKNLVLGFRPPTNHRALLWLLAPGIFRLGEIYIEELTSISPGCKVILMVLEFLWVILVGKVAWDLTPPMAFAVNYFESFVRPLHAHVNDAMRVITPALTPRDKKVTRILLIVPKELPEKSESWPYPSVCAAAKKTSPASAFTPDYLVEHRVVTPQTKPFTVRLDEQTDERGATLVDVSSQITTLLAYAEHENEPKGEKILEDFHKELEYQRRLFEREGKGESFRALANRCWGYGRRLFCSTALPLDGAVTITIIRS